MKRRALLLILAGASLAMTAAPARAHEDDFQIGRTAQGQLVIHYSAGDVVLPPITEPPLEGWGFDDPGFSILSEPLPANLLQMAPGNRIVVEVAGAGFDPALKAWLPGFGAHLGPGQFSVPSWDLGPDLEDIHPFWHIDSADPNFVPGQTEWHAIFRVIDMGATGYSPSEPITATFLVPEPGSLALLAIGGILFVRRHRRMGDDGGIHPCS